LRLASVTLPSSVQSIGHRCFGQCTSLATIAVPEGCMLDREAFYKCSPQLTLL
jgi:hypothetical protein